MTVRFKRNMKKMMSICLTRHSISGFRRTLFIPKFRVIHKKRGFLLSNQKDYDVMV